MRPASFASFTSLRPARFRCSRASFAIALAVVSALGLSAATIQSARACGCFAPPDVATPLVQAGEEILFVAQNGQVAMHVKLRYSGRAGDFGWLLPLPAVPVNSMGMQGIDVGSDELFAQLEARTQPTYVLQPLPCPSSGGFGCGASLADGSANVPASGGNAPPSPLVTQSSVGPYNYAILKADDESAMLQWLMANNYVVPSGTDQVISPYIRPGAYFLALKLAAGATAGDIQPVVLSYPSDLPMIPIQLTSVGATPHMGVLVWVLGNARAIPRNYEQTIINDAKLDWLNNAQNYNDVVTQAVGEADGKHSFVTEYAGTSDIMQNVLDSPGRFDVLQSVVSQTDPAAFIQAILPQQQIDFLNPFTSAQTHVVSGFALNGQFFAVVGAYVPEPQQLITEGVSLTQYYQQIVYYLDTDRKNRPAAYADIATQLAAFDPAALVNDLNQKIVQPTLNEGALFSSGQLSTLTRLYTTLSPQDMTVDPVFSFNPDLPEVPNVHYAALNLSCNNGGGQLTTEAGFVLNYSQDQINNSAYLSLMAPASQRTERLLDTGSPQVVTDNTQAIMDALKMESGSGCTTAKHRAGGSPALFLSLCAATLATLLCRRFPRRRRLLVK